MEEMQAKHRKEQRELQARITQKKTNATKKTRKGINDECETLERELKERQQTELDELNGNEVVVDVNGLDLNDHEEDAPPSPDEHNPSGTALPPNDQPSNPLSSTPDTPSTIPAPKKRNRQRDRLARRAAEQDVVIATALAEAASMPDQRSLELESMAAHMAKLNLTEVQIRPDGHCLYSAIATSLPTKTVKESGPGYQGVRNKAADFISKHPDEFSAFLEESLEGYTRKIRDTAEWGGAVELQALSKAYEVRINVLQSDGRVERIGEGEEGDEEIWLAYYRHSFGLGEHYNALMKKGKDK